MKLIICHGEVQVLDMRRIDDAFYQGTPLRPHAGYVVVGESRACSFLDEFIQSSMYEGGVSSGSAPSEKKFGWSWAVLPENAEESEHLRRLCRATDFRRFRV